MTTTSNDPARRVRVKLEPLPGERPWRAVIVEGDRETFVGRFDEQPEAVRVGISALRFVDAGIAWQPVGVTE